MMIDQLEIVLLDSPHEVRTFPLGRLELYRLGGMELGRAVYQPGWRWSEHIGPQVGTALCVAELLDRGGVHQDGMPVAWPTSIRWPSGSRM
jgi:hypothetical protein